MRPNEHDLKGRNLDGVAVQLGKSTDNLSQNCAHKRLKGKRLDEQPHATRHVKTRQATIVIKLNFELDTGIKPTQ